MATVALLLMTLSARTRFGGALPGAARTWPSSGRGTETSAVLLRLLYYERSIRRFGRRPAGCLVVIALRLEEPGFLLTRRHPAVPALFRLARAKVDHAVARIGGGRGVALEVFA